MKPLIIKFCESPSEGVVTDNSLLLYDSDLQLSVIKGSKLPAFDAINMSTETFTKTTGESTDSDPSTISSASLGALTYSANNSKMTENDSDKPKLKNLLATKTLTETKEASDNDK